MSTSSTQKGWSSSSGGFNISFSHTSTHTTSTGVRSGMFQNKLAENLLFRNKEHIAFEKPVTFSALEQKKLDINVKPETLIKSFVKKESEKRVLPIKKNFELKGFKNNLVNKLSKPVIDSKLKSKVLIKSPAKEGFVKEIEAKPRLVPLQKTIVNTSFDCANKLINIKSKNFVRKFVKKTKKNVTILLKRNVLIKMVGKRVGQRVDESWLVPYTINKIKSSVAGIKLKNFIHKSVKKNEIKQSSVFFSQ